uniref:Uncharacterized protein n=1 Tax=Anguilla anguilla TaxID=7936 RepID=A0A0E9QI96_ANGAN
MYFVPVTVIDINEEEQWSQHRSLWDLQACSFQDQSPFLYTDIILPCFLSSFISPVSKDCLKYPPVV